MLQENKEHSKLFSRKKYPRNFEITPRIVGVLRDIAQLTLVRKDVLRARHLHIPDRPFDTIINLLFDNEFIARPVQQAELRRSVAGSTPSYLSLDRSGRQLYSVFFADPLPAPKYTQENTRGKWDYIKHEVTTSTTLLNTQTGAANTPGVTHLTEAELWLKYAPASRLNQPIYDLENYPKLMAHDFKADPGKYASLLTEDKPLKLKTRMDWSVKLPSRSYFDDIEVGVAVEPDAYQGRQYNGRTMCSFVEDDEGTETILPNKKARQTLEVLTDTSLFQKLVIYIAAYQNYPRAHVQQFGITDFDVVINTNTPNRREEIVRKLGKRLMKLYNIHPNFVRVSDRATSSLFDNSPYHPDHFFTNLAGEDVHYLDF